MSFNWQWGAAVYSSFASYSGLNVNALDGIDPAGTPESDKGFLVFGDMGPGPVGMYVGSTSVIPTIAPASASPSSLNFGALAVGSTSAFMTSTLTNNQSGAALPISSITLGALGGTSPTEFAFVPGPQQLGVTNCLSAPNQAISSLPSGTSCTIYVTLTPAATGKRSAKVIFSDNANNSPQTVYLTGTGQ
jgi:hypothetical protein